MKIQIPIEDKMKSGSSMKPGTQEENQAEVKPSARTIIIEPAIILFFMFHLTTMPISSQYIYKAITERLNLSGALSASNKGLNESQHEGPCGPELNTSSELYKLQQQAQKESAMFMLVMNQVGGIPSLFIVLIFGAVMDNIGRKPMLITPIIGAILKHSLYVLQQLAGLPLETLWIASFLEATFGGSSTFLTAYYAYYADTIPEKTLSKRLSLADVSFMLSLAMMSVCVGFMVESFGFMWPLILSIAGLSIDLLYVLFLVPESRQSSVKCSEITPWYIVDSFKVLGRKRPQNDRLLLLIYLLVWILLGLGIIGRSQFEILFLLNTPFCWSPSMRGIYDSASMVITYMSQILIAVFLLKRIGDSSTLLLSLASYIAGNLAFAFSTRDWHVYSVAVLYFATGSVGPIMRSTMSQLVPAKETGSLFASLSTIDNVCYLVCSALYNLLYVATLDWFRGTVFLVMATFICLSFGTTLLFEKLKKNNEKKAVQEGEDALNQEVYSIKL